MTDPQWTIYIESDHETVLLSYEPEMQVLIAPAGSRSVRADHFVRRDAYDALVAAVNDAARIPQLEAERDALRLRFAGLVEGVLSFAEAETNAIIAAGLRAMVEDDDDIRDYLSPPVPGTPTPTGQT